MKRRFTGILLQFLLAIPLALSAQEAPAVDIVKLNEDGIAAYQAGNFEEAATKFRQAYAIQPENTLKKNEAVAWFKADKCGEALIATREFLALEGTDELSRTEARAVLLQCDLRLARAAVDAGSLDEAQGHVREAQANQPDPQALEVLKTLETEIATKRKAEDDARKEAILAAETRRHADNTRGKGSTSTLGLALMSGGGAIIVGTIVYNAVMLFSAAPKFRDVAEAGQDRDRYDALGKRLETANWLIPTLYAVGAVTAGVGVWFWMQGAEETAPTAATGAATPRRALDFGVNVGWRF